VPPLVCEPVIEPLVHKEKVARRFAEHASLHGGTGVARVARARSASIRSLAAAHANAVDLSARARETTRGCNHTQW
jgi:hypothetical protein